MSLFSSNVKRPFAFLPPIVWAVAIDALDIIPAIINTILTAVMGAGVAIDFGLDVVQTILAFIIFEDAAFAITNVDFLLPAPFDVFPAYTAKIIAKEMKLV
jgi:hypothetical protein